MSPAVGVGANGERGFPRVSGDEPNWDLLRKHDPVVFPA